MLHFSAGWWIVGTGSGVGTAPRAWRRLPCPAGDDHLGAARGIPHVFVDGRHAATAVTRVGAYREWTPSQTKDIVSDLRAVQSGLFHLVG